jgi:lysozyme
MIKKSLRQHILTAQKFSSIIAIVLFLFLAVVSFYFFRFEIDKYLYLRKHCAHAEKNKHNDFTIKIPNHFEVHGIDVSHYLCDIDWNKVHNVNKDSVQFSFVFVRSTIGSSKKDFLFDDNWKALKKNKFIRGAYHYFYPNESGSQQAFNFLKNVNIDKGDLPPVLDIEDTGIEDIADIRTRMSDWLDIVSKKTDCQPIIYCNKNIYEMVVKDYFDDYNIWIANYQKPIGEIDSNMQWLFWQHSQSGKIDGICENVDFNVFNGTMQDLKDLTKD